MASDLLFQRCQAYEVKWKKLPLRGIDTPLSDRIWLHQVTLGEDRKSTRLNSSHSQISYAVFCLKKKKTPTHTVLPVVHKTTIIDPHTFTISSHRVMTPSSV